MSQEKLTKRRRVHHEEGVAQNAASAACGWIFIVALGGINAEYLQHFLLAKPISGDYVCLDEPHT